ncbi:hypothetical protein [Ruminiclostridium cellobioparum]|uniref:hypothetical protein n=1 Tax=Ruminiclostridium cellobioparum TaxID=29355 RepID=UPI000487E30D|nr:hypothetical protein [Ruminiclostridium cellobioparum]
MSGGKGRLLDLREIVFRIAVQLQLTDLLYEFVNDIYYLIGLITINVLREENFVNKEISGKYF